MRDYSDGSRSLDTCIQHLLAGLFDQACCEADYPDEVFCYSGSFMSSAEAAQNMKPVMVWLAQDLAVRAGFDGFGYQILPTPGFGSGRVHNIIEYQENPELVHFFQVAPWIVQVFEEDVLAHRTDLERVFEKAYRMKDPSYSLDADISYQEIIRAKESNRRNLLECSYDEILRAGGVESDREES
jgi:hypothetical protein